MNPSSGMNLDRAVVLAASLGAAVERVRRTGELRFRSSLMARSCRVSGHRKDAARHLTVWLRSLQRRLALSAGPAARSEPRTRPDAKGKRET